jgi:hypothetical protein
MSVQMKSLLPQVLNFELKSQANSHITVFLFIDEHMNLKVLVRQSSTALGNMEAIAVIVVGVELDFGWIHYMIEELELDSIGEDIESCSSVEEVVEP